MKSGLLSPQGNFSADTWLKIYENELTEAATSVTISGLNGNTDVMYRLKFRAISGANSNWFGVRPNNDSATNYGTQYIYGSASTAGAGRDTARTYLVESISATNSIDNACFGDIIIYAKSGYVRTCVDAGNSPISGTTITYLILSGGSWNNTADNITSMVVFTPVASGLGIGTFIELWKPLAKV